MAGTAEILQEYLVSLGFKTDVVSLKKFDDHLGATGKKVLAVGGAVAGAIASVEAAAAAFAYSMRKTYYASELASTSVKNMKAMAFAGEQFGISGDTMASSIKGMAQAMRLNPGLKGLVESFGIKVTGRDVSDVMLDFVKATKSMPEFVGAQYAGMFGIDPDTYHQMISHMDEISAKKQEMLAMYKAAGVDPDSAKKTLLEYTQTLDKLEARLSMLGTAAMISLAPAFKEVAKWTDHVMEGWTWFFTEMTKGTLWDNMVKGFHRILEGKGAGGGGGRGGNGPSASRSPINEATVTTGKIQLLTEEEKARAKAESNRVRAAAGMATYPIAGAKGGTDAQKAYLAGLETQYGLPSGLLYKMWGKESGYGTKMVSPAGATGHFQFMPKTAAEYGLSTADTYDFQKSSSAAAKKMAGLIKLYNGDVAMATAAYNWGEGNLAKYGPGKAPPETVDYAKSLTGQDIRLGAGAGAGVNITQTNTFQVTGASAEDAARAVHRDLNRTNADLVRNLSGRVS